MQACLYRYKVPVTVHEENVSGVNIWCGNMHPVFQREQVRKKNSRPHYCKRYQYNNTWCILIHNKCI